MYSKVLQRFEKLSNMAKSWQKMKKNLDLLLTTHFSADSAGYPKIEFRVQVSFASITYFVLEKIKYFL